MDTDALSDLIHSILSEHSSTHFGPDVDVDDVSHILYAHGIDLSSYSANEIRDALDYAVNHSSGVDHNEISFGRSAREVQDDISWHKTRLSSAKTDVDYYSRELRRSGLSDTYIKNCESALKQAATKYDEETSKIKSLTQELDKILRSKKNNS